MFSPLLLPVVNDFFFDDSASEVLSQLFLFAFGCFLFAPESRNPSLHQQRCNWDAHTEIHGRRGTLDRRLRMSHKSFDKLLALIYDELYVKEVLAKPRGGAIIPEISLFVTLRWLAGGSHLDICDIAGISKASFYRVLWKTITATCKCEALDIVWPETSKQLRQAMEGFTSISHESAIANCVGVVDGYLMKTKVPRTSEAGNVRAYFSGHYQCYGVNIQAVSDHQSRFTYFAVAAPGKTGDRDAIEKCSLHDLIESLPLGACIIGDPACEATERLVTIFSHGDRLNADDDNFNFCASQCRIRIEMAFDLMQMKWSVLLRPLGCLMCHAPWIAMCVARLHNCVIDERLEAQGKGKSSRSDNGGESELPPSDDTGTRGLSHMPSTPHDENGEPIEIDPQHMGPGVWRGHSILREKMCERVKAKQLTRPSLVWFGKSPAGAEQRAVVVGTVALPSTPSTTKHPQDVRAWQLFS